MALNVSVMKEFRHQPSGTAYTLAIIFDDDMPMCYRLTKITGLNLHHSACDYSANETLLQLASDPNTRAYSQASGAFKEQVERYL